MNKERELFERLIERFSDVRILALGDIMVDRFIRGKVSRISPEAPVPVVRVKEEMSLPGGAGNVMMNLASLGAKVRACGVIGRDSVGEDLLERFKSLKIETDNIKTDPSRSTILKTRVIAEHQQVVRFDHENDQALSRKIQSEICDSMPEMVHSSDAIILSDYGKGMINKPILTRAIRLANKEKKPICIDPKIEHFLSYRQVTCITPNTQEALQGMQWTHLNSSNNIENLGKAILKKLRCRSVLITQGEEGMTLFEDHRITHIPTKAQEVYDVTGAGDTVISVLALALACKAKMVQAATIANLAAGIVVGKLGTATVSAEELKDALKRL